MTISKVGVVGAGSMGSGIANLAAISGFQVILHDVEQKFLDNGLSRINKFMEKSVAKGKMTEEQKRKFWNEFKLRQIWRILNRLIL